MTLNEILTAAVQKGASDVHLKAGLVPVVRKHGKLRPLFADHPPISNTELEQMLEGLMDEDQKRIFKVKKEIDLGYGVSGLGRFRVNIFKQRGTIRVVIRNVPHKVPTIKELGLPDVISKIADLERGLILVTGVTGSGKSSTLAAMIEQMNANRNLHILTIEDPIEFLIRDRKSIISQRELGMDTTSFAAALRSALRQDPDVILIGEMRDRETMEIALTAAETGHLVLSTLHTVDSQETINRILAAFEPHQHQQIRLQLASVLKAVVSQRLCTRSDKSGFIPAVEIFINNARSREMIEDPTRTRDIIKVIEESRETFGMQSFDQSLMEMVQNKLVEYDEALRLSTNPENFALRFSGVKSGRDQWESKSQATWGKEIPTFELDETDEYAEEIPKKKARR
jgi:twitching motility protein PilT